jgi:hypothetical protein
MCAFATSSSEHVMKPRQPDIATDAAHPGPAPQRPPRARLLVALAVPVTVMLALHQLAHAFRVPGDSLLAWAGAACAALVMAGAAALGQARPKRPR